ncbi:hypothetical protein [Bacillus cereus]|uniref:hypothetical protein n=1 Tax=Bacillus cereus TaxID=1396 RepID=UPI003CFDAEE4
MTERTPFLKALVGSHNYNLQVPESDRDEKLFVLPTFDDMLTNRDFTKSYTPKDGDDFDYKDVRHLGHLWWKSNVNFTEVLFSKELTVFPGAEHFVEQLVEKKEDIARMNLPYLYNSSLGTLRQKLKTAERNYKASIPMFRDGEPVVVKGIVEPWGKEMMTGYRLGDFFLRYHNNGFESFLDAIRYSDEERADLLAFRNQEMTYEEGLALVREKEAQLLKVQFNYSEEDGLKTKQFVDDVVHEVVKQNLLKEFKAA